MKKWVLRKWKDVKVEKFRAFPTCIWTKSNSCLEKIMNEASKSLWKMISADVKTNKNNKKKKIWWLYLTHFYKTYLQNLKQILVGILSILILSVKNRGKVGFLLNGQNPLSVTKVICRQSLKGIVSVRFVDWLNKNKFNFFKLQHLRRK